MDAVLQLLLALLNAALCALNVGIARDSWRLGYRRAAWFSAFAAVFTAALAVCILSRVSF